MKILLHDQRRKMPRTPLIIRRLPPLQMLQPGIRFGLFESAADDELVACVPSGGFGEVDGLEAGGLGFE